MSREEIFRLLDEHREALRRFHVRRLGLFGSAARGELRPESDLDILVELDEKTFDGYMDLKFFLEELLGRKVDLVLKEAIKPALRSRILEETVCAEGL